jgi:hypothetical protein
MPKIISSIKSIKNYTSEFLGGLIIFILVSSGFGVAVLLRYLNYNGYVISIVGISIEAISIIIIYFIYRKFIHSGEEPE